MQIEFESLYGEEVEGFSRDFVESLSRIIFGNR